MLVLNSFDIGGKNEIIGQRLQSQEVKDAELLSICCLLLESELLITAILPLSEYFTKFSYLCLK